VGCCIAIFASELLARLGFSYLGLIRCWRHSDFDLALRCDVFDGFWVNVIFGTLFAYFVENLYRAH